MSVWSILGKKIGSGPKSETAWCRQGHRGCLEEVAGYEKASSGFISSAVWEIEQAGTIEQESEKRRGVCFAYCTVR